jgi:hypothetical protein
VLGAFILVGKIDPVTCDFCYKSSFKFGNDLHLKNKLQWIQLYFFGIIIPTASLNLLSKEQRRQRGSYLGNCEQ